PSTGKPVPKILVKIFVPLGHRPAVVSVIGVVLSPRTGATAATPRMRSSACPGLAATTSPAASPVSTAETDSALIIRRSLTAEPARERRVPAPPVAGSRGGAGADGRR